MQSPVPRSKHLGSQVRVSIVHQIMPRDHLLPATNGSDSTQLRVVRIKFVDEELLLWSRCIHVVQTHALQAAVFSAVPGQPACSFKAAASSHVNTGSTQLRWPQARSWGVEAAKDECLLQELLTTAWTRGGMRRLACGHAHAELRRACVRPAVLISI